MSISASISPFMKKNKNIDVKGISITVNKRGTDEFICITDIAKKSALDTQPHH
jgi:hypothetical protein